MFESLDWLEDGSPLSPRFKERYHSCAGAVAQALNVFLLGCGLPQRWRGEKSFTVLETGFGLGFNFLTTWATWEADPDRCDQLQFYSVEAYPVSADDLVCAVQAALKGCENDAGLSTRMQVLAQELSSVWKDLSPGVHHFRFAQGRVLLTLAIADVCQGLTTLDCQADAVFLDGFSPSVNPEMWSAPVLQAVAQHCRPGTRLATYTIARKVRDGLAQLGFSLTKCKGLPPKRDRLEAVFGLDGTAYSC
jgi:tRNA 5-methylaminomethyl-2-thiouridine biosynthesis bifunctional protein